MNQEYLQYQQIAQQSIVSLVADLTYLPFTSFSIDYHSLVILINDIVVNKRTSILEFGTGISTVVIANLLKKNGIKACFYSIEGDKSWCDTVNGWLVQNELQDYVNLIYAPLEPIAAEQEFTTPWYNMVVLEETLGYQLFDMFIVDGPPAFNLELQYARYPALFFIMDRQEESYSLFLHDTDRQGEAVILQNWEEELKLRSRQFTHKLSGFIVGSHFNITI